MTKVTALPDQIDFEVAADETLLEAALRSGVPFAHACGGRAKCSTCRVWVLDGLQACPNRNSDETSMADRLRLANEVRLACQLKPEGELRVRRLVLDETDMMITSQLGGSAATRCGEAKHVAVFFSDIVDFTALSERLSPYDVMYLLNRYFAQVGDIIEQNGGFVDKLIGDGLMAIFGIDDQPDAPLRAVNAALQTLATVDRLKPFFASMYGIDFDIRIGLNYGEAVIGTLGSAGHQRLTAVGNVVNLASRVEAANKDAGTRLLISEALHDQIADKVEVGDFVRVRLRGTGERTSLFEIIRLKPEIDAELNARGIAKPSVTVAGGGFALLPKTSLSPTNAGSSILKITISSSFADPTPIAPSTMPARIFICRSTNAEAPLKPKSYSSHTRKARSPRSWPGLPLASELFRPAYR